MSAVILTAGVGLSLGGRLQRGPCSGPPPFPLSSSEKSLSLLSIEVPPWSSSQELRACSPGTSGQLRAAFAPLPLSLASGPGAPGLPRTHIPGLQVGMGWGG